MPSELRILRFRLDEAENALRDLAPRIGLMLPEGGFTSSEPVSGAQVASTCFEVEGGDNEVRVSNGQLAASLIYFCRKNRIDVPDEGTKEIYAAPDFVELRVVIRHATAATTAKSQTTVLETVNRQSLQSS